MPGRRVLSEDDYIDLRYAPTRPDMVRRRAVLRETLNRFATADPPNQYDLLAQTNLQRWRESVEKRPNSNQVYIVGGDWGEVTHAMTKEHGCCFAALNMANAFVPGGAYVEGAPAQEENMFRRTNCRPTRYAHGTRYPTRRAGCIWLRRIHESGASDRRTVPTGNRKTKTGVQGNRVRDLPSWVRSRQLDSI